MTPADDLNALATAPKALLHDHLDGGLRPTTIIELADECGWTPNLPATDPVELQAWFTRGAETGDILQYLATFEHTLAVLQTAEALERVAAEAVADLAADGVVYAELRFAPELHDAVGPEGAIEAVCAGLRRGEAEAGGTISAHLICCAMRTGTRSLEIAELVDRIRDVEPKVVGYDLAGAETGFPPSLHAEALSFARRRHLNVTLHASEPPDLELIDDAIVHGAHRIGHGVRLMRDTSVPFRRPTRTRRVTCGSARSPATSSTVRSTSRWRRRATSRSARCRASPSIRSDRSCGPGSRSGSTRTTG